MTEALTICRGCRKAITDEDTSGYCQGCLVDRINGAGVFEEDDDDLFAAPPRRPIRFPEFTRAECVVCGLVGQIKVDSPARLCGCCLVDLQMTKSGILARLEALDRRAETLRTSWLAAQDAAGEETAARLERAAEAGVALPQAFARTWARRNEEDSPLSRLLLTWEATEAECASIERQRAAEERALEEVDVAERN